MSTATTLIRASEIVNQGIVKGAPIGQRFDASLIAPNVYVAEIKHLKTFINQSFFNDLISKRNASDCNYNTAINPIVECFPNDPNYETLWKEKLFPYLSRAAYFESLGNITLQTRSQGIQVFESPFGQNAGIEGWKLIENKERNILTTLKNDLIKFLCENKEAYPLWDYKEFCSCYNDEVPKKSTYNFGIVKYQTKRKRHGSVKDYKPRW